MSKVACTKSKKCMVRLLEVGDTVVYGCNMAVVDYTNDLGDRVEIILILPSGKLEHLTCPLDTKFDMLISTWLWTTF